MHCFREGIDWLADCFWEYCPGAPCQVNASTNGQFLVLVCTYLGLLLIGFGWSANVLYLALYLLCCMASAKVYCYMDELRFWLRSQLFKPFAPYFLFLFKFFIYALFFIALCFHSQRNGLGVAQPMWWSCCTRVASQHGLGQNISVKCLV